MSELMLDSQPFNNYCSTDNYSDYEYVGDPSGTSRANDYTKSSIREWLNNNFYCDAFSSDQQRSVIRTSSLTNICADILIHNVEWDDEYNDPDIDDKIFLLSWEDIANDKYGFDKDGEEADLMRSAKGSDYAECQGLSKYKNYDSNNSELGDAYWLIRTFGGSDDDYVYEVNMRGEVDIAEYNTVINTGTGIRPALRINLSRIVSVNTSIDNNLIYALIAGFFILAATVAAIILILRMRKSYLKAGINNSAQQRKQSFKKAPRQTKASVNRNAQIRAQSQPQVQRQCPYCGGHLSPGAQFCKSCGNRVQ